MQTKTLYEWNPGIDGGSGQEIHTDKALLMLFHDEDGGCLTKALFSVDVLQILLCLGRTTSCNN